MDEFILAGQILAGIWCKWRHGKLWIKLGIRGYPAQGYVENKYFCLKCKSRISIVKRLSEKEADELMEILLNSRRSTRKFSV